MHIILGATGHVGSSVANELLKRKEPVTVITRSEDKAADWRKRGANAAVADVRDVEKLKGIFSKGKRLFLLNPPAPPDSDTVRGEKETLSCIIRALQGSSIEKIVAESTYGAQPGEGLGDLGVLYDMEQDLKKLKIPHTIIRGAYYMSNWDSSLDSVISEGKLYSFFPPDFKLPMVAPSDIGKFATLLLIEPVSKTGLYHIEGPARYSPNDVADAFGAATSNEIETIEIPPAQWIDTMKQVGFSDEAAKSMAAMTMLTRQATFEVGPIIRGTTTIHEYIRNIVAKNTASSPA